MSDLSGRTVVVTGGNSGIGYATARKLRELGAAVMITGRNPQAVDQAATELGVLGVVADQANLRDIDRLVERAKDELGRVDVLFINAGVAAFAPVEHLTEEQFDTTMPETLQVPYPSHLGRRLVRLFTKSLVGGKHHNKGSGSAQPS